MSIQSTLRSITILAILSGALFTDVFSEVVVRVCETSGGPQIHVNGKPVPPRFFYGDPGFEYNSSAIPLKSEWTSHSFEFMPGQVSGTKLKILFPNEVGEIWISNLNIKDVITGNDLVEDLAYYWDVSKLVNNTDPANTCSMSGSTLNIKINNKAGSSAELGVNLTPSLPFLNGRSYRCSFLAKAIPERELKLQFYDGASKISVSSGVLTQYIKCPPGAFFNEVALARDAGVDLVTFGAPDCWTEPEKPQNWAAMDNLFMKIISINPKVLLVPRVSANAPDWWLSRHPEARMVYDGNSTVNYSCISNRIYRVDVCDYLERLSRHLLETFPDNFAGIHPAGQQTGEWFYRGTWDTPLSGYDLSTRTAFREWLEKRGDPLADTAEPPTADERRAHPYGLLRDPAREKRLIEFALFQQQEMADHVAAMAASCRRGTDGKKLVLMFYGYSFIFSAVSNGAPTSGHYALSSLLKSKDIDILCSPREYVDRGWLGTYSSMTVAESVKQAGILWLNEDDTRTYLAITRADHLADIGQTRQVMRSNTAQDAIRGTGCWWMDLLGNWFNDGRIWEEMSLLNPVDVALLKRQKPYTPDIAAIVDEESMCHLTGGSSAFASGIIRNTPVVIGRSGAPYGQYLLDDVLHDRVPAKLKFFLSAWSLDSQERAALALQRKPGTTLVWCYAPGYLFPDKADVAGIKEVTGFEATPVPDNITPRVYPTNKGRELGLTANWGQTQIIKPLFRVNATTDETLATYSDGSPAVAVRHSANGTDVFVGVPQLTVELVRALARVADVHLFTEGNATLWAAEGYLSVQSQQDGPLLINTGENGTVVDALDGKVLGVGPEVTLNLEKGDVSVIKYQNINSTISTTSNPTAGGTTSGGGAYQSGQSETVTANANSGYTFLNWTDENGSIVSANSSYTFTVSTDKALVANFTLNPINSTISTSSNPVAGGATSGGGTYQTGQSGTVTASANSGYTFLNWTDETGAILSANSSYTFTVSTDKALVANFTLNPTSYTISTSSNPATGGATSGGGTYQTGQSRTVTANANSGYTFLNWTDETGAILSANSSYTFTVSADKALTANFTLNPINYAISTSSNPEAGGTTIGSGTYQSGQSCTITASPIEGYAFSGWTENGYQVSVSTSYQFTVSGNRSLVANFIKNSEDPNMNDQKMIVYPNPTKGQLTIAFDKVYSEGSFLTVADMNGKTILKKFIYSKEEMIDLNGYVPGVYLIKTNLPGINAEKIVLQ